MNTDKIVVGLAGMPGSGKSIVVETARAEGYAVVVMGDVIREETQKRGLKPTPNNIGKVMLELRRKRRKQHNSRQVHSKDRTAKKRKSYC